MDKPDQVLVAWQTNISNSCKICIDVVHFSDMMKYECIFTEADNFCDVQESNAGLSADALASVSAHNIPGDNKDHIKMLLKTLFCTWQGDAPKSEWK